eukprot:SAG11_NODE_4290_length_1967_cov_1.419165_2_plen_160_part_00
MSGLQCAALLQLLFFLDISLQNQLFKNTIATFRRQSMPAEFAFILLRSGQYNPGPRPLSFDAAHDNWFFKEPSGAPSRRTGCSVDSKAGSMVEVDRWHNSGGSKNSRDLPTGKLHPLVKRRYGAVEKAGGGQGFSYHEYVLLQVCSSARNRHSGGEQLT